MSVVYSINIKWEAKKIQNQLHNWINSGYSISLIKIKSWAMKELIKGGEAILSFSNSLLIDNFTSHYAKTISIIMSNNVWHQFWIHQN